MTSVKIPPIKTGIEFLASSHFHIGNENRWFSKKDPLAYKSTFKNDYTTQNIRKHGPVRIPPPSEIMHKDNRMLDQCSVTRQQFVPKVVQDDNYFKNSLTKTNFKMDRDDRIEAFETTHGVYYTAKTLAKKDELSNLMESHICHGDIWKEKWPESSYRQDFQSKPFSRRLETFNNTFADAKPIQGDPRSHGCEEMFNTSSRLFFPVHSRKEKIVVPNSTKYPQTTLPCGDKLPLLSTHQESFKDKFEVSAAIFDRDKALSNLQRTTFKIGDNRLDCFQTTTDDCYTFKQRGDSSTMRKLSISKSNVPEVCTDSLAAMSSINRTDYTAPPRDYRCHIVDGSNLHTISDISFGNSLKPSYKTTMDTSFPFKVSKYKRVCADRSHSSIPLKFYDNAPTSSSYRLEYLPKKGVKKLVPSAAGLENLVKSHFSEPISNIREFKSTHSDTYRPKQRVDVQLDVSSLQRSSVPIGTLLY